MVPSIVKDVPFDEELIKNSESRNKAPFEKVTLMEASLKDVNEATEIKSASAVHRDSIKASPANVELAV